MSIDLDSAEGRKQYLSEKLDDLLEGITDSYGTLLMEELLGRLELTIKDFNEEMKSVRDHLVKKEKERQQLLEMLKTNEGTVSPIPGLTQKNIPTDIPEDISHIDLEHEADIPEWEKKLARLEKK